MAARKKARTAATKKKTIKTKTAATKRAVPWGKAGKALDGVRILDFTHVQSGPTCTQLLGYMGADCIKVERPGAGDITRGQLRDIKGVDSLYFTMLNGNKRSITVDSEASEGQGNHRAADQGLRRAGGELRARHARSHGVHVGARPPAEPAHDHGVGQGLRPGAVRRVQGLRERRAMRRRRGVDHRVPRGSAARHRRADRRFRHRSPSRARHRRRAVSAQPDRARPARALRDAGRRAQPGARQAARPAAPAARPARGIQPVRRRRAVRQVGAARGQRLGRRTTGMDSEVQGLGNGSRRLHLFHHPGAGVGRDLRSDRQAGMEDRSQLRHAARAPAAAEADLRNHRRRGPRPRRSSR